MNAIKQYQIDPFDIDTTFNYDVRDVLNMSLEEATHLRDQLIQAGLQVNEYIRLKKATEAAVLDTLLTISPSKY